MSDNAVLAEPEEIVASEPARTEPATSRAVSVLVATATLLLVAAYYLYLNAVPDFRADQEHDPFTYIIYARSLLAGEGYPTKHWMPGFPVMLAGAMGVVGLDFLVLKLLMATLGLLTAVAAMRLFRRLGLGAAAPVLGLLLAATPLYFDYAHRLMSEVPFLTCSIVALVAVLEVQHAETRRGAWGWGTLLALSAAATVLIRGNGLALAPALGVAVFSMKNSAQSAKRWSIAVALLVLLGAFGAWSVRGMNREYEGIDNISYLQEVQAADVGKLWDAGGYKPGVERISAAGFLRRLYENVVWHQSYRVAGLVWPYADQLRSVRLPGLGLFLASLVLVPAAIGSVVLARRSPAVFTYLLFSLLITVTYPSGASARMLLPLVPLLIVVLFLGLQRLLGERIALGWAMAVVFANLLLCIEQADVQARHPYSEDFAIDMMALVRADLPRHTAPEDVVITDYPLVVRALAERRAEVSGEAGAGVVFVLERKSQPMPLGDRERHVIVSRGDVQLCRLGGSGGN